MTILDLYKTVKEQVDRYDCFDLLKNGCPEDEFELEATKICQRLKRNMSVEQIAQIMANVFIECFDDDFDDIEFITYAKPIKDALDELE